MADQSEWRVLEWAVGPDADRPTLLGEVRERHPELDNLSDDWFGIDVVCGRDRITRRRVMVRTTPPPVTPRRSLP